MLVASHRSSCGRSGNPTSSATYARTHGARLGCGSHAFPAGASKIEPFATPSQDVTLSWATFTDAANQTALSRYGSIHLQDGDLFGRATGRQVGALAWHKAQAYFAGTA